MKIGLEIHQRLDSNKLFCNCPSTINENARPDLVIRRKLHPVPSELGEIDITAKAEAMKNRIYEYQAFSENSCLVELDEEPPHAMNEHALKIVLAISQNLNCTPIDEVHMMRKTIIDGSNTSGFQRTAVVAFNGSITTSKGSVGIIQISIEEESCGIVSSTDSSAIYRLDRLGIPLIEITTAPDIKDGQHLLETAEKIGLLLRATGMVARGLGTIRQDINISVEGGARVEIKGAQDLKLLPTLVDIEVSRQRALLKLLSELKSKLGNSFSITRHFVDVTNIFHSSTSNMIKNGIKNGASVFGLRLPLHKGFLGRELQPKKRYGTELSDYAKLAGVKGIIHSDEELEKHPISENEISAITQALNIGSEDAFVLVIAPTEQAKLALVFVAKRAETTEVPKETRRANADGTTNYMRPLAGRARLYPETDVPPIRITESLLKSAMEFTGVSLEKRKKTLSKMLNPEMTEKMLRSRYLKLFEEVVAEGIEPMLIANTLENTLVSLRRDGIELENVEKSLKKLFSAYKKGLFVKAAIPDILRLAARGLKVEEAVEKNNLKRITGDELRKIAEENNFDVARIMQKYRLRIDPADVAKLKKQ